MASSKDYYGLLGVEKSAPADEIKKVFRKLTLKYHPDRNKGDKKAEEKFKEINEAYSVLSDANKRANYDRFGTAEGASYGGGGNSGFENFGFSGDTEDVFKNIFKNFFGEGKGFEEQDKKRYSAETNKGANLRYDLSISLEEAFKGADVPIAYSTKVKCEPCAGTGSENKVAPVQCSTCHGSGYIRTTQGYYTIDRTCNVCYGEGVIIQNPCKRCNGEGRYRQEVHLTVPIPAGINEGEKILVNGRGEAGARGAKAGNLYVYIKLKPHVFFKRNNDDIYCEIPVRMSLAALGGHVEVPTLEGVKIRTQLPEGTQTGDNLKLKSKGLPRLNSKIRGDMYVKILVETPVKLTKKQRDILEQFEAESIGSSPKSESFFDKVKDFWRF